VATATSITATSLTGNITDTNNNELITFTTTAAAINEVTIANAAPGAGPTISATGGDTDININLLPKGTGYVIATTPPTSDNTTKVATTAFVANGTSANVSSITNNIHASTDNTNAVTNGTAYSPTANIASGSRTFDKDFNTNLFNAGIDVRASSIVTITLTQPAFGTIPGSTVNLQTIVSSIDEVNNTFSIATIAFGVLLQPDNDFTFNFIIIR
jgi:hypothetical protein